MQTSWLLLLDSRILATALLAVVLVACGGNDSNVVPIATTSTNWTWVSGSNAQNAPGSYGTQGVAAPSNVPSGRSSSVSWTDPAGNLWLFGGGGFSGGGSLNDLWEYQASTGLWTWVAGANTVNVLGVYGVEGVAAPTNYPGSRDSATSWTDSSGNFWLFGGRTAANTRGNSVMNDLWKYNLATKQWTWVSGSNVTFPGSPYGAPGVYGTQGVPAAGNAPGGRSAAAAWTDGSNNLWLFGGFGVPADSSTGGYLNDLWKFDTSSGLWTWVSGSSAVGSAGMYGTKGTAAAGNVPGSRSGAASWISGGSLWLFGGLNGLNAGGPLAYFNDLWKFDPTSGQWTWVSGSNMANDKGSYGIDPEMPAARYATAQWTDGSGNLWLFGGAGAGDELWMFSPASTRWTWIGGTNSGTAVYGTQGAASPTNSPGSRYSAASWTDPSGNFWLFGGDGLQNDLWKDHP